ncbi:Alpha/Beta hydrolase protein [Aspergillus filifer]
MKSLHTWLWLTASLGCSHAISTIVDLGYCKYQDTYLASGVSQFLGIRYADTPVDDWRWRAPRNANSRSGIQHADHLPPICVGLGQTTGLNATEDCLFVNVFAPSNATIDSNLPVWVYIQGGGIILVNFNYRVGPLGFLASEEVRADGPLNVGLLDQRKLLHWVQEYIHLVCIAPSRGTSVTHHLTAYNGRNDDLFVGAIGESLAWTRSLTVTQSEDHFESLAPRLNRSTVDRMTCLRSLDASTVQTSGHAPLDVLALSTQLLFQPQGEFLGIPLILSYDTSEGSLSAPNASTKKEVASFVQGWSPQLNGPQIQHLVNPYPPEEVIPGRARYFPAASEIFADGVFLCPTNWITRSANFISQCGLTVIMFLIILRWLLPFLAPAKQRVSGQAPWGGGFLYHYTTYNATIVEGIQNYFISFVRSLDPSSLRSPSSPRWKRSNLGEKGRLKIQTNQTEMDKIPSDLLEKCETWYSYEESIAQE